MGAGDATRTFGDLLRQHREAAGLTQEELAERAGLTAKGISALERGERRRPYPATVRAIADALHVNEADRAALIASVPSRAPVQHPPSSPMETPGSRLPPESAAPLYGRDAELELLRDQLLAPEVRLMTVVGPGGVGKTRLATAAARSLAAVDAFAHGVWFVDLSPLTEPSHVIPATARTLGALDAGATAGIEALAAFLAGRRCLLVLDNFEQVLSAATDLGGLIASSPELTVLVTSREPLRLRWERTLPLQPLALPDVRHLPPVEDLARVPAVALFVERARASAPAFELSDANAAPVAELCVRLDGLPLAIELVAARAAQFGPAATLDRLARRLPVPGAAMRDAPVRQRSLRATLEWSLDLLEPAERTLFRRLAVFAGGWDLAAAGAVAGDVLPDVLGGLTSLADKSLIVVEPTAMSATASGEPRFRMLDTARSVALDLLEASGDEPTVRRAHARYFAGLAEASAGQMQGATQADVVARLEREEENFRQAINWTRRSGNQGALEEGLRLVGALAWYWFLHGYPADAREWFEDLLGPEDDVGPVEEGSATARALTLRAKALNAAGFRATDQGEYQLGATYHEAALAIWRRLSATPGLVASLHGVGDTALWQGNVEKAAASYDEGLDLAETRGTAEDVALFAFHLGQLSWLDGRLDAAEEHAERALRVARSAGSTTWPPYGLFVLASVAHERGETARAGALYREAIGLGWAHHDRLCLRMVLPGLAALATLEGDPARALRLAGAASALEENAGIWAFPPIRERHERWLATAREALRPRARAAAWNEGRSLAIDEVVADALAEATGSPADGLGEGRRLSPREREVLDLVALGRSNRQIAEALFVTEHTAKYHVASLFNKLGATNRAEAVSRAVAFGLLAVPED
ncbi:MAG TPA: LuxR C-terminal-related transcriptional regulator [Candidatus Limnocylindrales bacterium]|nr:LuxR C-terminal-related transcriptional regulator [Candidatus Limnocylindrales bacterium]